jgi:hypothetical protein
MCHRPSACEKIPPSKFLLCRLLIVHERYSRWNLPWAALAEGWKETSPHSSPFGGRRPTPPFLMSRSPVLLSIERSPSPTAQLVQQKLARDRTLLFLRGEHQDLLKELGRGERESVFTRDFMALNSHFCGTCMECDVLSPWTN